jgi:hypothetical protein
MKYRIGILAHAENLDPSVWVTDGINESQTALLTILWSGFKESG